MDKLHQKNEALIFINRKFGKEQDKLHEELKRNRSFRLPRTLQLTARSSEDEINSQADFELDDKSDYNTTRRVKHQKIKKKFKGKKLIRSSDDEEELDVDGARVRKFIDFHLLY